jgi:hydroxyacylglutathione hydrolase
MGHAGRRDFLPMKIEQFVIEGLGHQSYLISDEASRLAAVIDPRRDIEVYQEAAQRDGLRITHILETHIHNDYISGARELASRSDAIIIASASDPLLYGHVGMHEGERFSVGNLRFQTLATPGHTPAHVSYLLAENGDEEPAALFSGGSLLAGNAGRTDLLGEAMTLTLTRQQYHSLRRLLDTLPGQVHVYPTHGAGSFCLASQESKARSTTIAQERLVNPVMLAQNEDAFVERQLAGYSAYPAYYKHIGPINKQGPRVLGGIPRPPALSPQDIWQRMQNGTPLIDTREHNAFADQHIPGSLNFEMGSSFATYIGWLLPFNVPLMILIEDEPGRREAVVQLMRIGYEQVEGYLDGGISAWQAAALPTSQFSSIDTETLYQRWSRHERQFVLDVRRSDEWASGHIPGAHHLHVADLAQHLSELPKDQPIAVLCQSGYRSEIAASMIAATGREVIAVRGGMGTWQELGLPTETGT